MRSGQTSFRMLWIPVLAALFGADARADADEAAARAQVFLLAQQRESGPIGDAETSPLAALAARHAGADLDRPAWQRSVRWSIARESEATRPLAWEILLFTKLRAQVPGAALQKRVARLVELQHQQWIDLPPTRYRNAARPGEHPDPRFRFRVEGRYSDYGGWGKASGQVANILDTALAVWALTEAQKAGQNVGGEVFSRALTFLLKHQGSDGAWGMPTSGARGDATAAAAFAMGLALKGYGAAADAPLPKGGNVQAQIDLAVKWLKKTASATINPGTGRENLEAYRLWYGLLLDAIGQSGSDALVRIRSQLLETQLEEGAWKPGVAKSRGDLVRTTAWALLTLPKYESPARVEPTIEKIWARFGERASESEKKTAIESVLRLGERIRQPLILALRDERRNVREIAVRALREHTGQDFGFRSERSHAQNAEAFRQWSGWWLTVRGSRGPSRGR